LVAHYRDTLGGSDPDTAGTTALAAWLAAPFDPLKVHDVQSLWLLGLGLLFSFIGMAEGYMADDSYPGYGHLWRHYENLLKEYRPELMQNLDQLRRIEEQLLGGLTDLTTEIEDRYHDFLEIKGCYDTLRNRAPLFEAAKAGLERFPEPRVQEVLDGLAETRQKIIDEFTQAIDSLEPLG
jgi:hypothetical protein